MHTNQQLLIDYINLANHYGWLSLRAMYWRFQHRHNTDLMGLVRNAHYARSLFRRRSVGAISQWMNGAL